MKIKIYHLTLIILTIIMFISCEKWIDPDINVNPDSPEDPSMEVILPNIQGRIAYHTGGFDVTGTICMWMQQITGASRQAAIIGSYTFVEADVANLWNSFYRDAMMDLSIIIDKSKEEGAVSPYYEGIASVLMAYDLGLATQLWGDVPYSEAFQGLDNKHPKYDAQQEVYDTLQALLARAITKLQVDPADNIFDPTAGDMIYGGDLDLWIKTARVLQARYAIHLSKRNSDAYQNALDFLAAGGYEDNSEDCQFMFGTGDTENAPLYQFDEERTDAVASNDLFNLLITSVITAGGDTLGDPRLPVYQDTAGTGGTGEANFGSYFGALDAPVHLVTYVEQQFILAEALYNVGAVTEDSVRTVLKNAIAASLNKFSISDAAWTTAYDSVLNTITGADLLTEIMTQKYIAMFLQPEIFVDWRRTGVPALNVAVGTNVPRRFPYSSEERTFNRNIPNVKSIYARNWFDPE